MEISCNVIKDILPLYAEDMACEETKALVEAHLCCCDSCRNVMAELKSQPAETGDRMAASMKKVSDGIKKTRILTAATAVFLVITIIASLLVFLTFPVWATAEKAIKEVIENICNLTGKTISKEKEQKIINTILKDNVPKNIDKLF